MIRPICAESAVEPQPTNLWGTLLLLQTNDASLKSQSRWWNDKDQQVISASWHRQGHWAVK